MILAVKLDICSISKKLRVNKYLTIMCWMTGALNYEMSKKYVRPILDVLYVYK